MQHAPPPTPKIFAKYLKNGSTYFHQAYATLAFEQFPRISFEIGKLKTGYFLLPIGNQLMRECLAGKHDQSSIFSYYFLLIPNFFKSDDGETW